MRNIDGRWIRTADVSFIGLVLRGETPECGDDYFFFEAVIGGQLIKFPFYDMDECELARVQLIDLSSSEKDK